MGLNLRAVLVIKRISITNNKSIPNFIGAWQIEDTSLCDEIISFFESNPQKQVVGQTDAGLSDGKKSIDLVIQPKEIKAEPYSMFYEYIRQLYLCYSDYLEEWGFLKNYGRIEIGSFNVQRYLPGDHFKMLHTERDSLSNMHRIFAWMTYLNDVPESGETCFSFYDLSVKPEKGKTLIWPAEWTHAHSANILTKGEKYIVTGWMSFPSIV